MGWGGRGVGSGRDVGGVMLRGLDMGFEMVMVDGGGEDVMLNT